MTTHSIRPADPPAPIPSQITDRWVRGGYDLYLDPGYGYGYLHTHDGMYPFSGDLTGAYDACHDDLSAPPGTGKTPYESRFTVSPGVGFRFATSDGHVALAQIDGTISDTKILLYIHVWDGAVRCRARPAQKAGLTW